MSEEEKRHNLIAKMKELERNETKKCIYLLLRFVDVENIYLDKVLRLYFQSLLTSI